MSPSIQSATRRYCYADVVDYSDGVSASGPGLALVCSDPRCIIRDGVIISCVADESDDVRCRRVEERVSLRLCLRRMLGRG